MLIGIDIHLQRRIFFFYCSKGSVLVDYFVELSVAEDTHISTTEMRKSFHDALKVAPMIVEPEIKDDEFDENTTDRSTPTSKPIIKETYLLGHFKLDPVSTDFIGMIISFTIRKCPVNFVALIRFFKFSFPVIPKPILPIIQNAETSFLPQWAIAVIVIGMASLLFVIVFGVSVVRRI